MHIGEKRVLDWGVSRCESAAEPDLVVVATGDQPENEAITELCRRKDYEYVIGPEDDLLARHRKVVQETGSDLLVRVTADCPFVPPEEVDRTIREHRANDASYTRNSYPDEVPTGIGVDVLEPSLLDALHKRGEKHPIKLALKKPEEWGAKFLKPPKRWADKSNIHMAVDTPQDYWSLVDAVEAVGPNPLDVARWIDKENSFHTLRIDKG